MSIEENMAVAGRGLAEFWGRDYNPAIIDELAALRHLDRSISA